MSFTDQKSRVVTKEDMTAPWSGHTDGSRFYCRLCGYLFQVGDVWRWVYHGRYVNFMVCVHCDNPEVKDDWTNRNLEWEVLAKGKFRFIAIVLEDLEKEISYG